MRLGVRRSSRAPAISHESLYVNSFEDLLVVSDALWNACSQAVSNRSCADVDSGRYVVNLFQPPLSSALIDLSQVSHIIFSSSVGFLVSI